MTLRYIRNLDALRALAALGVIVAHAYSVDVLPQFPKLASVAYLGNFGVSLFFVLSGFVITRILIQTHQDPHYFRTFYVRRLLRIFPLYYIGLAAYYFLPYLLGWESDVAPAGDQLIYAAYLQNFSRTFDWGASGPGHYWSLAVEEHFYLLWPAVVLVAMRVGEKSLIGVSLFLVAGVHVLRVFMLGEGYDINVFTFTRLDQLVYGGLIAVAEFRGFLTSRNNPWFMGMIITGCGFILVLELGSPETRELFKYTAFGITFTGLVLAVSASSATGAVSRILQAGWLQYLGKISYGLYVWHVLVMAGVTHYVEAPASVRFLLVVACTILFSAASFRWLEAPFLKLKDRFSY